MTRKTKVNRTVKVNVYRVLSDAMDIACVMGVNRAHKHNDDPSKDDIADSVYTEVMNTINDILHFGE